MLALLAPLIFQPIVLLHDPIRSSEQLPQIRFSAKEAAPDNYGFPDFKSLEAQTLDAGIFGERDSEICKKWIKQLERSKSPQAQESRHRWLALYAQQISRIDPLEALQLLAPDILGDQEADAWRKDLLSRQQQAKQENQKAVEAAKKGKLTPPSPILTPVQFPNFQKWSEADKKPELVLAAALALARCHELGTAKNTIDQVGGKLSGTPRALAAETSGDVLAGEKQWQEAIAAYDFALQQLKYDGRYADADAYPTWIKHRVGIKKSRCQAAADLESVGPAYALYRSARQLSSAGLEPLALLKYQELSQSQAGTIYADAAETYSLSCLRLLAAYPRCLALKRSNEHLKKNLEQTEKLLQLAISRKAPLDKIEEIRQTLKALQLQVKTLASLPRGAEAYRDFHKRSQRLLAGPAYGLYQGEIMYETATAHLQQNQLDKAAVLFEQVSQWCKAAPAHDAEVAAFSLTDGAQKASAPPATPWINSGWNREESIVPPQALFHRRSCSWYLADLQKKSSLHQGLCAMLRKDAVSAATSWEELYKLDPEYKLSEQRLWGSPPQRLLWDLKHNTGGLYGTAEELAVFKDPELRVAAYMADLELECEYPDRALAIWQDLIESNEKLSKDQLAYIAFAKASCSSMRCDGVAMLAELRQFKTTFKGSPPEPRALLMLASQLSQNSKQRDEVLSLYHHIIKTFHGSTTEDAHYQLIKVLSSANKAAELQDAINSYRQKYPKGKWLDFIDELLKKPEVKE